MRTYLSGPVSLGGVLPASLVAKNIQRFRLVRETLEARGIEVVDPTQICPDGSQPTWLDYMRVDIKALVDCDAVLMLPGWHESRGARVERQLAEALGMPVSEYEGILL